MIEWREYKLNEIYDFGSGLSKPRSEFGYGNGFLSYKDIFHNYFVPNTLTELVNSTEQEQKVCSIQRGDVFLTRTSETDEELGMSCVAIKDYPKSTFNGFSKRLRPNGIIDVLPEYAGFFFRSTNFRANVSGISSITTRASLNNNMLSSLSILVPPINIQRKIAETLKSLHDKIDLLHRQNTTLEKMAETLFRQWFVEEAQEDWEEGTLNDILTVKGGTTPSTREPAYWNGSIHWTSPRDITNLNGIYLFDTERKITELGLSKISSGLLPEGTLLMSSRAPVGVLAFCEVPVAINQGYIAILDNKGYSKEFIYLWLKASIDVVHSFSNGSTFMEISKSAFKTLQLKIPPKQVVNEFQLLVEPIFNKIKSNQTQIRTLTTLRDTLLPKLMSGEVRIE